jgi:site-specific DNA recombinase
MTMSTSHRNAAIYCRVSTRQQAEDGSSLDSQEVACRRLAAAQGFTIIQAFKEDFPGTELARPLLDQLRSGVKSGAYAAVFCYATDRLSRSPVHLALIAEECQKCEVELVFVTEPLDSSPEGQLLTFVRGWAAQLEREKIKDRTIRGKQARMKQGKLPQGTGRTGSAFGYSYNRVTGKREVREEEALVVAEIFNFCDSGISPNRIAVILNERGITSPMGCLWDPRTVRFLLRNEIYVGKTWSGRTRRVHLGGKRVAYANRPVSEWVEIKDATPAIIAPELFSRVQERLSRPFRVAGRVGEKYLL